MDFPTSPDFAADPFPPDWSASHHADVIAAYEQACTHVRAKLFAAPIVLLGRELFLDPERFVADGDKIHVLSGRRIGPVHFAGAVFYDAEDFIDVEAERDALQPIVPPIQVHER